MHRFPPRHAGRLAVAFAVFVLTALVVSTPSVVQAADLAISKSSSVDVVEAGEAFEYRILVSCSSATSDCIDAVVTDVLPIELSGALDDVFVAPIVGADATYDDSTRTATWTFTNDLGGGNVGLSSGSSLELILQVLFPAGSTPDGTVATNTARLTATVDSTETFVDSNPAPVAATASFEFEVRKSVRGGVAPLGLPVTYDVQLCSPATGGLDLAAGATLRDTLPPGAVFVSATNGGAETTPGSGVVEWTLPEVAADGVCRTLASVTVEFPEATFNDGDNVTNLATLVDPVPVGSVTPEPSVDGSLTHPLEAPTGIGGAGKSGPSWLTPGQAFTYTLTIESSGFLPITDAVLTDTIPAQVDVTSITVPAGVDRALYTSDDDPTLRPFPTLTPGVAIAKSEFVGAGDHIASVQFEADTVGSFESLNVLLGAVVLEGTDRDGLPIVEGTGQSDGTTIANCTTLDYLDHTSTAASAGPTCTTALVKQEFAVPRITKSGDPGPFLPGATVSWDITVTNTAEASTSLDEFVIRDLVPDQYDDGTPIAIAYVPGSATVVAAPTLAPDPVVDVSVDATSGRTLLQWRWTTADSTSYSLDPGESITVRYSATLPDRVPPGPITNHAALSDWTNEPVNIDPDKRLVWECDPPATTDAELAALTGTPVCFDNSSVEVIAITGLDSVKWVRGEADIDALIAASGDVDAVDPEDAGFTRFPQTGSTYQGGYVDYRLVLNNPGNVGLDDINIIDILPDVGDSGVLTGARGSQWRPILVAPLELPPTLVGQVDVYYSSTPAPCYDSRFKIPVGCADWSLTPPSPISETTAILYDFDDDYTIAVDETVQLEMHLVAPAGTPIDGAIAWNSFAYSTSRADTGGELLPAEPRKVGIDVTEAPATSLVYGNYVWFDFDHDGIQDPEESGPTLTDQPARPTGLDGVRVQFYRDVTNDGPSDDDVFVRETYTTDDFAGNPGFYSFPELDTDDYYTVFDVPAGYELTQRDQGVDDAVDSDARPATLTFDGPSITPLASASQVYIPTTRLTDDDLSFDVGFWQPTNLRSSLGDTVWYDNNTTGLQDVAPDGIAGVTVRLWWVGPNGTKNNGGGDDRLLETTTTDANGNYRFDWLVPGPNYYVEFVTPAALDLTRSDVGADDTIDSDANPTNGFTALIDLDNGPDPATGGDPDTTTVEPQWDAGMFFPNTIGDRIWEDQNRNGIQEAGDNGISGVTVRLYQPGPNGTIGGGDDVLVGTTTTDGIGLYQFTGLPNGEYFVVVTPPSAAWRTSPTGVGADDAIDSDGAAGTGDYAGLVVMSDITTLQIAPGTDGVLNTADDEAETDPSWDFGFYRLASIGNVVFEDLNRNGRQDAGEPGVGGVTVELLDGAGSVVATTSTSPAGQYEFTGLEPGTYSVRFDPTTAPTSVGASMVLLAAGCVDRHRCHRQRCRPRDPVAHLRRDGTDRAHLERA